MSDRYASPSTLDRQKRKADRRAQRRPAGASGASETPAPRRRQASTIESGLPGGGGAVANDVNAAAATPRGNQKSTKTGSGPDVSSQNTTAPGINIPMSGKAPTPFSQQFDYNASGPEIYGDPEALAADWMAFNGYNPLYSNGLTNKMKDYAARLDTLFALLGGGSQSIADFVGFAGNQMDAAMNPAGGYFSEDDIAKSLGIGQGQNYDFLQQMFNNPSATARQNADTYLSYFGNAMNGVLTPVALNALLGVMSASADNMVANSNKNQQQDPIWQQLANIAGGYFGV